MKQGLAGNVANLFINSKLSILLMITFLIIGLYSSSIIPREEEPQIDVPIADIFLAYPGASPAEVESKVVRPLEKILSNIKGVEHIYSTSMNEQAMIIVQFFVGEDVERSLVKLYNEVMKNMDRMPPGTTLPLIKSRAIDDVPALALTLWSDEYDDFQLRQLAQELNSEIEKINDVAITRVIGGRSRQISVRLDKDQLAEFQLDFLDVAEMLKANNQAINSGTFDRNDEEYWVRTGTFLKSAEDVAELVVGAYKNQPVYLKQVAQVVDGPEEPKTYVSFGYGRASGDQQETYTDDYPAVTISVAKRKGADAMQLADKILEKVELLKSNLIPDAVHVEVSRNYGVTASQKVSELLLHLIGSILAVTVVVMLAMGWRGGLVVFLSVPTTFALTLFAYYFMDYTLNRITLFALVFVTGIVVDDSIIIAENMHRHFKMGKLPFKQAALFAINEVGNPTILATFTVIASVLPMAFVSGLMGPYMSPMPIGASIAMLFSLLVALTITPYLGFHILKAREAHGNGEEEKGDIANSTIYKVYSKLVTPLLNSRWKRWLFLGINALILLGTMSMFLTQSVAVKMLPFDNKNEIQAIIDMPEGTTLERTSNVAREVAMYLSQQDEVVHYQTYAGTAAPITFNGLVRHYDLRGGSHMADVQVNLTDKHYRSIQSHDIAKKYREGVQAIGDKYGANIKIVEVPPGPPVLSTLVAEVYGPDYEQQIAVAKGVRSIMENTKDVVDVDWRVEDEQLEYQFNIDKEKAMLYGIPPQKIVATLNLALSDRATTYLYAEDDYAPVGISLLLGEAERSSVEDLKEIRMVSNRGSAIPIGDLVEVESSSKDKSIYRKNQRRVVYVTGDMAGDLESPVYAIFSMGAKLKDINLPAGYELEEYYMEQPFLEDDFTVKWDGEWQITLEVFRDLGIAFGIVLLIIYVLIVGWFQNFQAPVVMMVAIPLSLIGIILGHYFFDAYFTATSMIGMIALAGIMVRNSVLLIDFIQLRLDDGIPFQQAVLEAGAVRTTPILLTAGTVVIGAFVILFDPIFQGLAISLMCGTIASTVLTLIVVPLVYYLTERKKYRNTNPA
jgi:multidrug efflux pump subunit AcrB